MGLSSLLYNIGVSAYHAGIKVSAPFNTKAQQWVAGRRDWQTKLRDVLNGKPVVWVHCASLGEYEQGKPVIEALEAEFPQKQVLVSFYSPSGYEVVARKEPGRAIIYLPADSNANAKAFLQLAKPTMAIFIKYEFWYHYLQQLKHHKVPTFLVSGIFREGQPFFKPWGMLHREMLKCFSHFFLQDEASAQLLHGIGFRNVTVSGDTRFDRVMDILNNPKPLPVIEHFKADAPIFIAGSTWPADESILLPLIPNLVEKGWKVIVAPHNINTQHMQALLQRLGDNAIAYSQLLEKNGAEQAVEKAIMVIDNVGLLANVYRYGELAYIGGGLGKGIHNILEAAASGLPIIFGPNYAKFKEAVDLVALGGAFPVDTYAALQAQVDQLLNEEFYADAATTAHTYVQEHLGATNQVMVFIKEQGDV